MGYGSVDECDDMTDLEWNDGSIPNKPSTAGLDLLNETEAMNQRVPHICGMDIYGIKIMPQMSDIATIQDIHGMLIFEDEHAADVQNLTFVS